MSWSEVLSVINSAGLYAAVVIVTVASLASLMLRKW
jgi:hypothetical protein